MSEEVLSKGRFRVDRRRALEKMERFQLADPRAYTLELFAAAVASGANAVHVRNDSDDFEIAWEGDGPTRAELDALFDHLFGDPQDARGHLLQHLAVGIVGALGQRPRWIRVDRAGTPPVRLEVLDLAETLAADHDHGEPGTRVHVRQRFTADTLAEALFLPLRAPPETRYLLEHTRWSPVPVRIDGKERVRTPIPDGLATIRRDDAHLSLVHAPGGVAVVRHGVAVATLARADGPLALSGWIADPRLRLDASRAGVVRDEAWARLERALDEALLGLLDAVATGGHPRDVLVAAATWRVRLGKRLGPFADVPLVVDTTGRAWSATELAAFDGLKGPAEGDLARILGCGPGIFSASDRPLLDLLCPKLPDVTHALEMRAAGRTRRSEAEKRRLRPEFTADAAQRRFERGPIRGAVRWRDGGLPDVAVDLRISGAPVGRGSLPSPAGPMEAILDSSRFMTDDAFTTVLHDAARKEAEGVLLSEAAAFAIAHAERWRGGGRRGPHPTSVLTAALRAAGARARQDLPALLAAHPDPLLRVAALPRGDGGWASLPDVLAASQPWRVVASVPAGCPPDLASNLLVLPDDLIPAWLSWLGPRAVDARATLAQDIAAAEKRRLPRRKATLDVATSLRVPVEGPGWTGELGLAGSVGDARVELLCDGVRITTVTLPLAMGGVVGIVDDPTFPVDRAHGALVGERAIERLAARLAPTVDALARAAWDATDAPVPPEPVLAWLASRKDALPGWADPRPVAIALDGTVHTPAGLRARASDRKAPRVKLVSGDPAGLPGFDDAVRCTPAHARALQSVAPRAVRDAEAERAETAKRVDGWLARPAAEDPPALATRPAPEMRPPGRWILPADPARIGRAHLDVRWRGRTLATRDPHDALGAIGIVEGPGVEPSGSLTDVRDGAPLNDWLRRARTTLPDLAREALRARDGRPPAGELAAWRALLARLDGTVGRSAAEEALRDELARAPLFVRLDETRSSRAELVRADGPVRHVPSGTERGPTDTPWYILADPWTLDALAPIRPQPGAETLAAWREWEGRRRAAARREAKWAGPALRRTKLQGEVSGEVVLLPTGMRADGLRVEPLVEGIGLDPVTLPFPAPAVAVVEGPAVRADASFRRWAEDAASRQAKAAIRGAAEALARDLADDPGADARVWLARYAFGDRSGPGAALPIFPTADGGRLSVAEIEGRAVAGELGVVPEGTPPFVAGPQPVVALPWVREAVAGRFRLVDLWDVAARHAARTTSRPTIAHAVVSVEAFVGWAAGVDAVEVRREGVVLATVEAGGILPITGFVDAPDAEVDPLWRGLTAESRAALQPRLEALAFEVAVRMAETTEGRTPHERAALLGALGKLAASDARVGSAQAFATGGDDGGPRSRARGALARTPLFVDSEGRAGALAEVIEARSVRAVEPGTRGVPTRGRVWQLGVPERAIVGAFRPVVDATAALREEAAGASRRAAARRPPPRPPAGVTPRVLSGVGTTGEVWLADPPGSGVEARVEGAVVQRLDLPVPGIAGWVEGPFATDRGFTRAEVGPDVWGLLAKAARELLSNELADAPARAHARLTEALAARGHDPAAVISASGSPWSDLPIVADTRGNGLDLAALRRVLKAHRRLVFGLDGTRTGLRGGEPVLAGGDALGATVASWFPGAEVLDVAEVARRAEERETEAREKAEAASRERRERAVVERAIRLGSRWVCAAVPRETFEAVAAGWAAGRRPEWPPFDRADADGTAPPLVALAAALACDLPPGDHVALVQRFAEALAEAGKRG